ncbi:hypothetical protein [Arthrobacter sp. UYCo732]|uniref:hypothetical protein n=1 Tax=Arthrobacter sp. UYCo732 TaxID=3156336 RepID=UPI0033973B3D
MKKLLCVLASIVALLTMTSCAPKLSTAEACSEYNTLTSLMISSSNDDQIHSRYGNQLKDMLDKAPDTVKADMHAIYLLMTDSPDAKRNPEAAQRIEVACKAAKG